MKTIFLFLIGIASYIILDFLWIGLITRNFYKKQFKGFGRIERGKWKLLFIPALFTWILLTIGILIFVKQLSTNFLEALFYGGLMGFIIYGVYDLTNLSTIKEWSLELTAIDILWGTIASSLVSLVLFIFY